MVDYLLDDISLWDFYKYREAMSSSGYLGYQGGTHRSPYSMRWISVIRQWCLPVLFWVSGAAIACSYRGGCPRGIDKLMMFTAVGMGINACLWCVSPMEKECTITKMSEPECQNKGLLVDFSICGGAGAWFAILFQMWYTIALSGLTIINWPLLAVTQGSCRPAWLIFQGLLNASILSGFLYVAGGSPDPAGVAISLFIYEAVFQFLCMLNARAVSSCRWPDWLPIRLLHYLLALVTISQFSLIRFADEMLHINGAYLTFINTGFSKFFCMGFIMTDARKGPHRLPEPLVSACWPVMLFVIAVVSPSTNWQLAGMMTYPFFHEASARFLYVSGAMVMVFCLDRISRGLACRPLPDVLSHMSLLAYLIHPALITILLAFGMREVMHVWLSVLGLCLLIVSLQVLCQHGVGACRTDAKKDGFDEENTVSSSED